ncbi:unnamed protein product, partial [Larinioides sclopetarius]
KILIIQIRNSFISTYLYEILTDIIESDKLWILLSKAIALSGVLSAVSNFVEIFPTPGDPIIYSLLEIVFFLGIHGIVFHVVFLTVSIILIIGSMKDIPPLLIPWIAWTPFFILAIIVNVVMILIHNAALAVPVVCFTIFVFMVKIYSTLIVTYQFKELVKYETRRTYLEGLTGVRQSGPGFSAYFDRDRQSVRVIPMDESEAGPSSSNSDQPRKKSRLLDRPSMRDRLSHTYAKVLMSTQQQQNSS